MTSSVRYQEYTVSTVADTNVDDGLGCIEAPFNFKRIKLAGGIAINSSLVITTWTGGTKILDAVVLQISSPTGVNYADTTICTLDATGRIVTLAVGANNPVPSGSEVSLLLIVGRNE
jgi:hypothetical protein